ncbi:hypothetical protein [Williamsia sp. 1135]|uniref:hypothetical protein n=1 Tax=Williamsia sp. 1135 TaxID=1889262 RepID=UPI000A0FC035|nr:hypothetical protein [Williamsia sp. 1135]ORM37794.1 hypothetical protein BFL43_03055 [Williamsia sp. 1135]
MTTTAETHAALTAAEEHVELCTRRLSVVMTECVDAVASQLTDRLDALAKVVVIAEPAITLNLGTSGVEQLRRELAGVAHREGTHLRSAVGDLDWNEEHEANIARTMGKYLSDRIIPDVKRILTLAGYTSAVHLRESTPDYNEVIYAGKTLLIFERDYPPLGDAFSELFRAEHTSWRARQAHELACVEEVWDASTPANR